MGVFDTYCCFCAGPLENGRQSWIYFLQEGVKEWPPKDGEWHNPPDYPVPQKPIEEIVTIDEEDGKTWNDWVVVSPVWAKQDWVSPPCCGDSYGSVEINGDTDWNANDERFLRIHRICLSFLCRRLSISPQALWESLYIPGADYLKYGESGDGLLYCVKYHDMEDRNRQNFGYAVERQTPQKYDPENVDRWYDPETMNDTAWILSRPSVLPLPKALEVSPVIQPPASEARRVFDVPELLDAILTEVISIPEDVIVNELKDGGSVFDYPSVLEATRSLLSLAQVDRWFYRAIVRDRQGLFLRLASSFGWMLPCIPADWSNWPNELTPLSLTLTQSVDWRYYLLTCLRKEDLHVRNRFRFHRMTVQFARGRAKKNSDGETIWRWNVGQLGFTSSSERPEPKTWEEPC
ncbi:hypothetical protein E1B28_007042 [Marasmius oreades]|uniref:Uncharacterized protein n=1 Tax=Marasmius oreades TaxID=181124 RepID=A0A9P7S138_9AGAR|nr:uncharacterized protein E1B28_007042 [Marasmius oreades]KAG7093360.1 hypothetical protein E1B28_007042 [Marasmius oreades]